MTIEPGYYFATYANPTDVEVIYVTQSGYICRHSEDKTYALDAFTIGDKIELPDSIPSQSELCIDNRYDTFLIVQDKDYPGGDIAEILTHEFHTERIAGTPELTLVGVAETIGRGSKIKPIEHVYVFTQEDIVIGMLQKNGFTSSEGRKYVEGYHVLYRNVKEEPFQITRPGVEIGLLDMVESMANQKHINPRVGDIFRGRYEKQEQVLIIHVNDNEVTTYLGTFSKTAFVKGYERMSTLKNPTEV